MKTFFIRLAAGLGFGVVAIAAMLLNEYTFFALGSVILIGSLNEYFNITQPKRETASGFFQSKWFVIALCYFAFVDSFMLASPPAAGVPDFNNLLVAALQVLTRFRDSALTLNATLPLLVFVLFIAELFSKSEKPFENLGRKTVAIFWIVVPVIITNKIYFDEGGPFILAMFMLIWIYDSFCYIFGSLLGKTKLFERISPKKTVEGMIGGIAVTLTVAYFANIIPYLQNHSRIEWMILAFFICIAATFGDLVESLLKRSLRIKDSGNIMPGHGGFLDRMDAYFLVVPVVATLLWWFMQVKSLMLVYEYLSQ